MRKKPRKLKSEDIYNEIIDSLVENELGEFSTPQEYLESQGIDAKSLLSDGLGVVGKWGNKVRIEKRRLQYEAVKARLHKFRSQLTITPLSDLRTKLADIIGGNDQRLVEVYWHKLEEITDADLEDMIKDQRILDIFIEVYDELDGSSKE